MMIGNESASSVLAWTKKNFLVLSGSLVFLIPCLQFLQRTKVNEPDMHGGTALHHACRARNQQAVHLLLKKRPVFIKDKQGRDPVELATQKGFTELCDMFESYRASLSPLAADAKKAIEQADWQGLEQMAQNGAEATILNHEDEEGTLLHYACARNQPECVRVLLKLGADPAIKSKRRGQTALHLAAQSGVECLKQLLQSEVCSSNICESIAA
jgi:ankyrin repeat protein